MGTAPGRTGTFIVTVESVPRRSCTTAVSPTTVTTELIMDGPSSPAAPAWVAAS